MGLFIKYLSANKTFILNLAIILSFVSACIDFISRWLDIDLSGITLFLLSIVPLIYYRKIAELNLATFKFVAALLFYVVYLVVSLISINSLSTLIVYYNLSFETSFILTSLLLGVGALLIFYAILFYHNFAINYLFFDMKFFQSIKKSFKIYVVDSIKFLVVYGLVAAATAGITHVVSGAASSMGVSAYLYGFVLNIFQLIVIMSMLTLYMTILVKNKTA